MSAESLLASSLLVLWHGIALHVSTLCCHYCRILFYCLSLSSPSGCLALFTVDLLHLVNRGDPIVMFVTKTILLHIFRLLMLLSLHSKLLLLLHQEHLLDLVFIKLLGDHLSLRWIVFFLYLLTAAFNLKLSFIGDLLSFFFYNAFGCLMFLLRSSVLHKHTLNLKAITYKSMSCCCWSSVSSGCSPPYSSGSTSSPSSSSSAP